MNQELTIVAAFDWLKSEMPLGMLAAERLRNTDTYRFSYADSWLRQFPKLVLGADIANVRGPQFARGRIFGPLQDALPDRWGRRLIDKRERILAAREGRLPRTLSDYDYLVALTDSTRMGALRFMQDGQYVGTADDMTVPPLTHLREFIDIASEYERQDATGGTIREEWLRNLYQQGSSLGGARPKANVIDTDGSLCIAKIPSIHDDYDIALWEHWAHCMARLAGIRVAETRVVRPEGQRYHTLLSRRFDRQGDRRVHFASAMTMCGLQDGADADSGNGYLDIVDSVVGAMNMTNVHDTLVELYRRIAFSICIGNHDDHFRNHGFVLTSSGWQLSPAYDLNPSTMTTQSLLISPYSNESSLDELRSAASFYYLSAAEAEQIIAQVTTAMTHAAEVATRLGISPQEQQRYMSRFEL